MKYESMREKTFKRAGLPHSSSKIWRLQNEANQKAKQKNSKVDDNDKIYHDFIERLSASHDITLRFGRIIEEIIISLDKVNNKMLYLLENTHGSSFHYQSKVQELEIIHYKDISKFKEMESDEMRLLDTLFQRYSEKEKDILTGMQRTEDKFIYYERSMQNLESNIDTIIFKHQSEKNEMEARAQELVARCSTYSEHKEQLKLQNQNLEKLDQIHHENRMFASQNAQLKTSLEEATKSEKKIVEKYSEESMRLINEINSLNQELTLKQKELEGFKEKLTKSKEISSQLKLMIDEQKEESSLLKSKLTDTREECYHYKQLLEDANSLRSETKELKKNYISQVDISLQRLRETFAVVKEITHEIFLKYEKSQQEWHDERWRGDIETPTEEFSEVIYEAEFLSYMINKLACDNNWLVDRMAELGQENYRLREEFHSPRKVNEETIIELKAASSAMKGFEQARSKLLSQFSGGSKESSLKY